MTDLERAKREILHGRMLAELDTEMVWGWGTPAGRARSLRRGQRISDGARLAPGLCVLEIGCGTGLFTEMFVATGATVVAIDISPHLLKKARRRNLPPDRVRFIRCPLEDSDRLGSFDAVIGSSVLHHLDLRSALLHIRRLLKPGGRLSFAEPNMLNPQVCMEKALRRIRPLFPHTLRHERAFVRGRLQAELLAAGFQDSRIAPMDWLHPLVPWQLIPTVTKLEAVLERAPVVREFAGSLYLSARRGGDDDR